MYASAIGVSRAWFALLNVASLGFVAEVASPTSGAREDDKLLGRSGHRDIAVDRSLYALAERLWVDEDDQVELEPFRQFRGQRQGHATSPGTWDRR